MTDRTVELQIVLASVQITADNTNTDTENNQRQKTPFV